MRHLHHQEESMEAYQCIVSKRDTRAYLDKPIDEETLRRVLQAGRMAGSSKNTQPVRLVVLRERSRREGIAPPPPLSPHPPPPRAPPAPACRPPPPAAAPGPGIGPPPGGSASDAGGGAQNMMVAPWTRAATSSR